MFHVIKAPNLRIFTPAILVMAIDRPSTLVNAGLATLTPNWVLYKRMGPMVHALTGQRIHLCLHNTSQAPGCSACKSEAAQSRNGHWSRVGDYISCAHHLIQQKYTCAAKLVVFVSFAQLETLKRMRLYLPS